MELTIVDTPLVPAQSPQRASSRFTRENALEMAARAVAKRKLNRELTAVVNPVRIERQPDYVEKEIARTRAQIAKVQTLLDRSADALVIERLTRSLNALSERERILSGRPLPGARRPGRDKPAPDADIEPL
ncbi:MAG TPA: hypothetical protein VH598_11140 [Verrucomicrobiae bacterium]|jgi:hypothetical protein|nr:hypothetical protein [Verrucomicrobiae bacterium]